MARKGIMLAHILTEKKLAKLRQPVLVQPKLDGKRCRAQLSSEDGEVKCVLLSSEENYIPCLYHIEQALINTCNAWLSYLEWQPEQDMLLLELDGELFTHEVNFQDIVSRVNRTVNPHVDAGRVQYHIFDTISIYMQEERILTRDLFLHHASEGSPLIAVPTYKLSSLDEWELYCAQFIEQGYEGIIFRDPYAEYETRRSPYMLKYKPRDEGLFHVMGSEEEETIHKQPKNSLGALVTEKGKVGTGFTQQQRKQLWEMRDQLSNYAAHVKHQGFTKEGLLRFPVFVKLIPRSDI